jgi:hypothetical protein
VQGVGLFGVAGCVCHGLVTRSRSVRSRGGGDKLQIIWAHAIRKVGGNAMIFADTTAARRLSLS